MSDIGLMDKGSNELTARGSVTGTDRIPIYTTTGTEAKTATVTQLSSGSILGDDNAFTGDNTFAGTSGLTGAVSVGKSGTAGDISVYPATGSKGKLAVTVQDQTTDTTVTLDIDEHGQATVVNLPDGGAATTNLVQSTLPLTLAEANVLDGAVAGTQAASKAVIPNSDVNIGVVKATELHLGATGAETKVTSSGTELNYVDVTTAGVAQASKAVILDAVLHQNVIHTASLNLGASGATSAVTSTAAELNYNDVTAVGTAQANKALVCDGSIDISGINTLGVTTIAVTNFNATNIDAGASGTAGSVDVYPTTAASGKLTLACTDQSGDTAVTLNANAMAAARTINIADPGSASYVMQSTAAITLAEADVLDAVTAGTVAVSKAVVVDASKDIADFRNLSSTNVLVGKDAVAGTLTVFPATTATGITTITSSDNSGATTTNINVATQAGARTLTVPDGGQSTANFLLSEGATTIAGVQTYSVPQVLDHNTTITAFSTGGQGSAVALTGQYNEVTVCAADYDSVKLLTAVAGQKQTVKNSSANILSVFPNTDDTINGMAVNLSVDVPAGGEVTFRATGAVAWETMESVYLSSATTQTGGLKISAAANAANYEVALVNASHGQSTVLTIPDGGSATASVLLTKGAQTIDGVQSYTVPQVIDANTTITAFSGGGQGSAVALTGEYNNVTTVAAAFDSVALPTAVLGQKITVKNSGASILSVFPASSDSINALAVNLSVDIPLSGEMTFTAISDTIWETVETLYLSSPTTQTGGIAIRAAANASNVDLTITNASQAAARTYTIADAGASAEFVMNIDTTDHVKFMGMNDIIGGPVDGPTVGTWTLTRLSRGDYMTQKTATDETAVIPIDITEALRTTSSKGLKLVSFDVIFRNVTGNLDAHSVTLDKITYTDSAAVTTTSVALTGALGVLQDNDPQIDNVTLDSAAFNITDDSKYVMEVTVDAGAASVYDFIGIMLKFTRNDK